MKKSEKLFEAFTELDDDLIENALPKDQDYDVVKPALKINSWKPWVAGAAVAAAALGVVFAGFKLFGSGKPGFAPAVESGESSAAVDNAKYSEMMVDWVVYDSAEELVDASDIICTAKVNDISFALIDPSTGKEIEDGDDPKNGELCTIYDIYLTKVYKSNVINKGRLWFRVMGGLKGYKIDEQLDVLKRAGSDTIPIMHEPPEIELGEEYLFLLAQFNNALPCLINAPQAVYPLSNPAYRDDCSGASAQDIIDFIESQTLDLSSIVYTDKLENNNPHLSAEELVNNEDVICTGTVTNISFAVLDLDTCLPPTENSVDYKVNLFTIYDIDLINSYKGNVAKHFKLVEIGGIKGYKVGEQLDALDSEYLKDKNTIPVWSDPPDIKIGEEYLFVMRHSDIEKPCFFGHHKQTALPLSDPAFRDEYSGASVKDIINCVQGNAAVENYMELTITHNGQIMSLTDTERANLAAAVQNALANDCLPENQLKTFVNDDLIKQYSESGFVIDLVFNDIDAPLAGGGEDKKAKTVCHATVLIGEFFSNAYLTYSYTSIGFDGSSENNNGGTYAPSAETLNAILNVIDSAGRHQNNSNDSGTGTVKLFDYYDNPENMPKQDAKDFTLSEFPGATFQWTQYGVQVFSDDKWLLYTGSPVYGVYLADLNGDGKREICSTADSCVYAYDYANGYLYEIANTAACNYSLEIENGELMYVETAEKYQTYDPLKIGHMTCHSTTPGVHHEDHNNETSHHEEDPGPPTYPVTTGTHHDENDETHH